MSSGSRRRQLHKPLWPASHNRSRLKKLLGRKKRSGNQRGPNNVRPNKNWPRKGLRGCNKQCHASGACPDPITNPLGWCEYTWAWQNKYEVLGWADNLWSTSPMDHKQLVAQMVCLWGLVGAYWLTHQSIYMCPPTPHVLEAYNHKVNQHTKSYPCRSTWLCSTPKHFSTWAFATMRGTRIGWCPQYGTSGKRSLSPSGAGLFTTWTPPISLGTPCVWTMEPRSQTMESGTT